MLNLVTRRKIHLKWEAKDLDVVAEFVIQTTEGCLGMLVVSGYHNSR